MGDSNVLARDCLNVLRLSPRLIEMCCDEDMQVFRRHDIPFIRIPSICGNPEIEKLASMGLKFQWEDASSGQWKECIGQRQRLFRKGEVSQLTTGMHLFSILTQRVYVGHNNTQTPAWMATGYRNTVKKIKYDHLKQTQTLETMIRRTVPWPKDNTVNKNRMRLQAYLQGKGADTVFDDKEQMAKPNYGGPARGNCDLCYSLMTVSASLN